MGYRTFVTIKVVQYGPGQTEKDFRDIIEQADPCMLGFDEPGQAAFQDNNGNCLDEIVQLSTNYPDMILEADIDGTSEESNDQREMRICNGEKEENSAEIIFPPFCKILTEEEKESSSRAGKVKEYKVTALYESAKSQILDLAKTFLLAIRDELVQKEGRPAEPGEDTFTIDLFSYPTYITLPVNVHDTFTEEEYEEPWIVNAIRYGDDGIAVTMEEGSLLLNSFDIDKIAKVCRYLEDILKDIKNGKGGSILLDN